MRLSDSGTKQAQVLLVTDQEEQGIVSLTLRATGRRTRHLMALERHLAIQPGRSATITIFAIDYQSDQRPSPPELSASGELTLTFDGWTLVHPRHDPTAQPARWQGRVEVRASSLDSENSTGSVTITSAAAPAISIPVTLDN